MVIGQLDNLLVANSWTSHLTDW